MKNGLRFFLAWVFFFSLGFILLTRCLAIDLQECEEKIGEGSLGLDDLRQCEDFFDRLYQETEVKKKTLETEISRFNTAINLTTTRILATGQEIEKLVKEISRLSVKITRLDLSLDQLSKILVRRVSETYKKSQPEPLAMFFLSRNFSDFMAHYKYLKAAQLNDRKVMIQVESVRTNYEDQKNIKEEKQLELEAAKKKLEQQKNLLAQQKLDKETLLKVTKSDEKRYQQLLAASRAEIEAIQRIIAGEGECSEAGRIDQGGRIASVITGASACSLGTHLHFEIRENSEVKNPLAYLKNISLVDDSGGDPHTASGDWEWPLNEPIRLTQGFGSDTSAIRSRTVWYDFHTGIDLVAEDSAVKAVKAGDLYRCAIKCGSGTLRYVMVNHEDSNLNTYYLHVNY